MSNEKINYRITIENTNNNEREILHLNECNVPLIDIRNGIMTTMEYKTGTIQLEGADNIEPLLIDIEVILRNGGTEDINVFKPHMKHDIMIIDECDINKIKTVGDYYTINPKDSIILTMICTIRTKQIQLLNNTRTIDKIPVKITRLVDKDGIEIIVGDRDMIIKRTLESDEFLCRNIKTVIK